MKAIRQVISDTRLRSIMGELEVTREWAKAACDEFAQILGLLRCERIDVTCAHAPMRCSCDTCKTFKEAGGVHA